MRKNLTTKDIKYLKSQSTMGYLIALLLFIFGTIAGITVNELYFDPSPGVINAGKSVMISAASLILAVLVFFKLNWKYFSDIRNNEKIQIIKTLRDKNKVTHYYKSTVSVNYDFIVDNISLSVNKELFDRCQKGDKLILNYAPESKFLLSIEKSEKGPHA